MFRDSIYICTYSKHTDFSASRVNTVLNKSCVTNENKKKASKYPFCACVDIFVWYSETVFLKGGKKYPGLLTKRFQEVTANLGKYRWVYKATKQDTRKWIEGEVTSSNNGSKVPCHKWNDGKAVKIGPQMAKNSEFLK